MIALAGVVVDTSVLLLEHRCISNGRYDEPERSNFVSAAIFQERNQGHVSVSKRFRLISRI